MEKPSSTSSSDTRRELGAAARLAARFFAPLLVVVTLLNLLVESLDLEPHYRMTYADARQFGPAGIDTLVLGASNGKYGVDPRALEPAGGRVLNQCLNGAGPLFYPRWYGEYYRSFAPAPRRAVLVLNEYVFDPRYLVRRFEHDSAFMPWPVLLRLLFQPGTDRATLLYNRLALTRYRASVWFTVFRQGQDEEARLDLWYRGFVPIESKHPFARGVLALEPRVDEERVVALRGFVRALQRDGAEVAIVNPPICFSGVNLTGGAAARLRELAAETGARWLDYNHELASDINRDRRWFVDWEHLNLDGARAWSARLASDLGPLPEGGEEATR